MIKQRKRFHTLGKKLDPTIISITYSDTGGGIPTPPNPSFVSTWEIENGGDSITIPIKSGETGYDGIIQWEQLDGTVISSVAFNDANKDTVLTTVLPTAGTYRCRITGTFLSIYANFSGDCEQLRTVENLGYTGLTSLDHGFYGCEYMTSCQFGDTDAGLRVTSLKSTWSDCYEVIDVPDISSFTKVNDLTNTWNWCTEVLSVPEVNDLTLVTSLRGAWEACFKPSIFPDVDKLILVNTLESTWEDCREMVSAPNVNTLLSVSTLERTWGSCYKLTNPSNVNNLTNVASLKLTWNNCWGILTAPPVSNLILVDELFSTWSNCRSMVTAAAVSSLTNVTSCRYTWMSCHELVDFPVVNTLVNVTEVNGAWSHCHKLVNAPDISDLNKLTGFSAVWYNCQNIQTLNIPTNLDLVNYTGGWNMLEMTSGQTRQPLPTATIDGIINRFRDATDQYIIDNGYDIQLTWKGADLGATNTFGVNGLINHDYLIDELHWSFGLTGLDTSTGDVSFKTTWKTTTDNEQLGFPTTGTGWDGHVIWTNKSTGALVSSGDYTELNKDALRPTLPIGEWQCSITGSCPRFRFTNEFQTGTDQLISVDQLGIVNMESMIMSYKWCTSLESFAFGYTDINKRGWHLTDTFSGCTSLTTMPSISRLTKVQFMDSTFSGCTSLTNCPNMDHLELVTTMDNTFLDCGSINDLHLPYVTRKLTTGVGMFGGSAPSSDVDEALRRIVDSNDYQYSTPAENVTMDLGSGNTYTSTGQINYNRLVNEWNWIIISGGLE